MKKLINEEMSTRSNTRQNAPNIVARLMGMDALPLDAKPVGQPVEKTNSMRRGVKLSEREKYVKGSAGNSASNSIYTKQMDVDGSIYSRRDRNAERWSKSDKFRNPQHRHPQEEELKKFKKEFEAWQAARFRECSKVVDFGGISTAHRLYADSDRVRHENPSDFKRFTEKENLHEIGLHYGRHKLELFTAEKKESRRQCMNNDFQLPSMIDYNEGADAAPTRIVILKPGPDRYFDHEESWISSSSTFKERASIEDFIDEVRERLKLELQGKTLKKSFVVRGSGIETPFSENTSGPRKNAKHITKQVGENISMDLRMNLVRSESTKSYRSDIQFNGPGSTEFINKDTRRFLSERLRNVLKQEIQLDVPTVSTGSSRSSSVFDSGRERLKRTLDVSKCGNDLSYCGIVKDEQETQTSCFRLGDDVGIVNREMSPRNLIRSLSAPVSGTSFGKLLLEDRHVLTCARFRRKHEGNGNVSSDVRKRKKVKFNLKEKLSNIKYGLNLRRMLVGKRIQSMVESYGAHDDPANDIFSGQTVVMNFRERHENSTEVPPSPASVCSTAHEELWRQVDYLSPMSTPDVNFGEDYDVPQVFKEISSNLNELRRQLNELKSNGADDITTELEESIESEMVDLEDHREGCVRDLLVASGLYDGSCDKSLSRWDPLAKPISNSVFEQVEESYRKFAKENKDSFRDDRKVDHRMLMDLSNEALAAMLGPQLTMSRFRRKLLDSSPLRGRKLLNSVWAVISISLCPPNDGSCNYSLDSMVARDLGSKSTPWYGLMDDETNVLGKEVECQIIGDLIEEIAKDICRNMHS